MTTCIDSIDCRSSIANIIILIILTMCSNVFTITVTIKTAKERIITPVIMEIT